MHGDEVVRREDRARVVERPRRVGQLERTQAERLRQPEPGLARRRGLGGHGRPRAVELLGCARRREGLKRVDAEAARVRRERRQGRGAADVGHPRSGLDRGSDLGDRRVRHAQEDELGRLCAHGEAPLA